MQAEMGGALVAGKCSGGSGSIRDELHGCLVVTNDELAREGVRISINIRFSAPAKAHVAVVEEAAWVREASAVEWGRFHHASCGVARRRNRRRNRKSRRGQER